MELFSQPRNILCWFSEDQTAAVATIPSRTISQKGGKAATVTTQILSFVVFANHQQTLADEAPSVKIVIGSICQE